MDSEWAEGLDLDDYTKPIVCCQWINVNGQRLRVDTVGDPLTTAMAGWDGVLPRGCVDHVECETGTVYGVPREFVRAPERPDTPKQDHSKRSAARQQRLDTVAAMVATYPDSTARELCEHTGFGHPAMQDYLRTLREAGVVDMTIPEQIGYSGKRPYTFRIRGAT